VSYWYLPVLRQTPENIGMESKPIAPRFSLNLPMRYRPQGAARWRKSSSRNVSSSGAQFTATEPLPPGSKIEMEISMAAGMLKPSRVQAISEVVRQTTEDDGLLTAVKHLRYEMHPDEHPSDWLA
jgi:hypothetical protein